MKKNRVIGDNATGETLTPLVGEEENSGACQLYEVCLPPHRPSPPLHYRVDFIETFAVKRRQLHIYVDRDQKHLPLSPGDRATAYIRQPHRFANDHEEPVIFTIKTEPAGGVVKAFQLAYGIANDGGAAKDGLPKNSVARLVLVETTQGYLPVLPGHF